MPNSIDTFIAGCAGGMAQVLAGQPFDMVKVRLQAATAYKSMVHCLTTIIKNEGGLRALWKGSLPPLMSVGAAVSLQFGINEKSRSFVRKMTGLSKLKPSHYFSCGSLAGLINSIISIPTEHSRIRMQIQSDGSTGPYKSSMDCIKKIIQQHGIRGLYKGGVPTVLREGLAFGIYFSFYEWLVNKMLRPGQSRSDFNITNVIMAGSLTGVVVWLATFPIDVVKTKIQVDSFSCPQYKGMINCIQKTYKNDGLVGFYKGFSPCLLRAIPANGATFLAYEAASQLLSFTKESMFKSSI
jgi:solute carrier family 25 carnitine/acylcarnitine transporter 20/29